MDIRVKIPLKADIIFQGFVVLVAPFGKEWSGTQLGDFANKSGVYIHHCNGKILYIGKTTSGQLGTFSERFRRQFQEKASQNSQLYQLLNSQKNSIRTVMFDLNDLDMMIDSGSVNLTKETKALIMEQILIGVFQPEGNRMGINPI